MSGDKITVDELKVCPFCGKKPGVFEFSNGWHVECYNDDCKVKPNLTDMYHLKDKAILAWNTRTDADGQALAVEKEG